MSSIEPDNKGLLRWNGPPVRPASWEATLKAYELADGGTDSPRPCEALVKVCPVPDDDPRVSLRGEGACYAKTTIQRGWVIDRS